MTFCNPVPIIYDLNQLLLLVLIFFISTSCSKPSLPSAILSSYPSSGDTTVFFEFDAGQSFDSKTYPIALRFRWDFDGDREWDTEYSTEPIILKQFPATGTYPVSVEVMNLQGYTAVATDTIIVFRLRFDSSSLIDPRDGQTYSTVNIGGRWWMADCLRYGTEIDPLQKQMSDNGVPERIVVSGRHDSGPFSVYSW